MQSVRMELEKEVFEYDGTCDYQDYVLNSYNETWRDRDRRFLYIEQFAIVCSAYGAIRRAGGYVPHIDWTPVESIAVPLARPKSSFVILDPFDESGRCASVDASLTVRFSRTQRVVQVFVGLNMYAGDVFVSPHRNFLVGARAGSPLCLSSLLFLDVAGLPDLPR